MTNRLLEKSTKLSLMKERSGGQRSGVIQVWVTDEHTRFERVRELEWRVPHIDTENSIVVDPTQKFQEVVGFGSALTDAACYLISELPAAARRQFLQEMFDPSEMGLSVCRICIGSSDYARSEYSYDDGTPDPEMQRFSIEHDRAYILSTLVEALEICPSLLVVASPWSPPGWMKVGGSMLGGSIRQKHFPAYAKYFTKFIESYAEAGVPIHAVTVQNEVDTDQEGLMPACLWGQSSEMRFVAEHLGPCFRDKNISTKIWILDHNYDLWGRAVCQLADPAVSKFVDGVAWHGYAGKPHTMTLVQEMYRDKHMYWTEGGPENLHDPHLQTDWAHWGAKFAGILNNWARCIITWNLALDENGKPNIGPFACAGLVTIDSQTKQITPSGQYWALAHYSRSIQKGSRRIHSQGTPDNVSHVAVLNPDGSYAMSLTNTGESKQVSVTASRREVQLDLPADSLLTLAWDSTGTPE
jgi:glucosylceramidase